MEQDKVKDPFLNTIDQILDELRSRQAEILCVDDEPSMLNVLERIFSDDFNVYKASSGAEGLEILKNHPNIELIISDQRMPVMSGTEFLNRSREINPSCIRIILTGYTDIKDLVDSINTGKVFQYVTKPFEPDELRIIIKRGIEYFRKGREVQVAFEELQKAYIHLRETQNQLIRSEKMSMLGQLMANIAHEIRNPISNINNSSKLLALDWIGIKSFLMKLDQATDIQQIEAILSNEADRIEVPQVVTDFDAAINIITHSCELAGDIIEDLRGFSRLDDAHFVDTDVNFQINRALKLLQSKYKHQIEFKKDLQTIPQILGFPGPIAQVLINIMDNAAHAMDGKGVVEIHTRQTDGYIVVDIADHGSGIPEENIQKIFDYGFTTKGAKDGTGLGLAISQEIVKRHKGKIEVNSKIGEGSTFSIYLPVKK
jgi:two-component system, NtrC family, sensor kinase